MPTGSGKSTVGLLYLKSHMAERGGVGVYLCPTLQLAEQVLFEAKRLGLSARPYGRGQPHPHPDCLSGDAVVVCSYDKLFNARTTFDRSDVRVVPDALVLDDAHAGVEEVRDAFTLRISEAKAMAALTAMIDNRMNDFSPTLWRDVKDGDPRVVIEIPYWHLADVRGELAQLVEQHAEQVDRDLHWPLIRSSSSMLRGVVGRGILELTLEIPAVREIRPYHDARHRLFMSGTLSDDTVLVRELDCAVDAALTPVVPSTDSGIGERMLLAPFLLDPEMDRDWVIAWAAGQSENVSVVVLCSSADDAANWGMAGAETPSGHDEVVRAVEELRTGDCTFAAFAQRFDGVDLPDDACRILIIDGVPRGQSLSDEIDAAAVAREGGVRNRVVYRIEQGMGRAVRSTADYAVVILSGADLASFVSATGVRAQMSAEVQAQLGLGRDLINLAQGSRQAPSAPALDDLVGKCLRRSSEWKEVYNERVRTRLADHDHRPDEAMILLAHAERGALVLAVDGDAPSGVRTLSDALNDSKLDRGATYARLLQTLARIQFVNDREEAVRIQRKAYAQSHRLLRPPVVAAATSPDVTIRAAADSILRWYKQFAEGQGAVADVTARFADLRFGVGHTVFEDAVELLGHVIGAQSQRPERDEHDGPDNLWRWKDTSILIECKSKSEAPSIPKKDLGQITMSLAWFERTFPGAPVEPVMMIDTTSSDIEPDGRLRVMATNGLAELKQRAMEFVRQLATRPAGDWSRPEVTTLLRTFKLAPSQLVEDLTKKPRKRKLR